jgi:hypothetical protein
MSSCDWCQQASQTKIQIVFDQITKLKTLQKNTYFAEQLLIAIKIPAKRGDISR